MNSPKVSTEKPSFASTIPWYDDCSSAVSSQPNLETGIGYVVEDKLSSMPHHVEREGQPPPPLSTNPPLSLSHPATVPPPAAAGGTGYCTPKKQCVVILLTSVLVICVLLGVSLWMLSFSTFDFPSMEVERSEADKAFILDVINSITLSGRTLRYPSTEFVEERAVMWLIDNDLSTHVDELRALRQRYALATLREAKHYRRSDGQSECLWEGIDCDMAGRVTRLNLTNDTAPVRGSLPADLGLLTAVTELNLSGKGLVGTIPSSLGTLTALSTLDLSNNKLIGYIPTSLGGLTALTSLLLGNNQLMWTIPSALGALTVLNRLALFDNLLTGDIPASLGGLAAALTELSLAGNDLSGTIPSSLAGLTALTDLRLNNNKLTGTVPLSLGSMSSMIRLGLNNNGLNGTIPMALGDMTALTEMDLSSNELEGTIPLSFGNLTALTDLWLNENKLNGTIPFSLGSLSSIIRLGLNNNGLTGTIPSSLTALKDLSIIQLFNNRMNGTMPFCSNLENQTDPTFSYLAADCDELSCPCCTECCPKGGFDGIPGVNLTCVKSIEECEPLPVTLNSTDNSLIPIKFQSCLEEGRSCAECIGRFEQRRGRRNLQEINARHLVESDQECAMEAYDMYLVVDGGHFAGLAIPKEGSACPSVVFHAQAYTSDSELQKIALQVHHEDLADLADENMLHLGSKSLSDIVHAFEIAPVSKDGALYDAITNNCVVMLRNMADPLNIPIDERMLGFITKKLTSKASNHIIGMMKESHALNMLYEGSRHLLKGVSTDDLLAKVIKLYV